ncbi:Sec-independent protein translocase subunit TatA [Mycobacterium sp. IDR2000157661]|uniref:Sec-independent protein translocase subunit TatA n=1 Tax=Mycobacterium sp. IDR2000157661 TaxID=2867005 RepID=UPI001EEBF387|nr:Sec-independent protein translocase subunit TatA [Mycobacterium sp. IDR2000157661]ULE32217.1 Sec-independent protein translocase subunit TatA [Mycobacterium sp. IDR2000157661]
MGGLQPWHWVIVIAVFVLLFGAKKLPDAARSLGKSMRIFKSEIKEMQADSKPDTATPIASERVDPATHKAAGSDVAAGAAPETEQPSDKRPA